MNKFAMAVATVSLLLSSHSQAATVIQDVFWGAGVDGTVNDESDLLDAAKSGDVYGGDNYNIDSVEATLTQNLLTVVIKSSSYFSSWISGAVSDAPGDLYLSTTGWTPAGSASDHYNTDQSDNGTAWNYVVSLSDIFSDDELGNVIQSGSANLYKTQYGSSVFGYERTAQEVWFAPSDSASIFGAGSWSYQTEADGKTSLLITMDISDLLGIDWDGKTAMGFHFTMDCGNDVIEGSIAPVPLPSACLLLGSALVGLMGVARRRIR